MTAMAGQRRGTASNHIDAVARTDWATAAISVAVILAIMAVARV